MKWCKPIVLALLISLLFLRVVSTYAQQIAQTLSDGLLGLTQEEVRGKCGLPTLVTTYNFQLHKENVFTLQEWEAVGQRIYGIGDDVFYLKPKDIELRYSFHYFLDTSQSKFRPKLVTSGYKIEFDKPISVRDLATQIPQIASIDLKSAVCYGSKQPLVSDEVNCILPSHSEQAKTIRMLGAMQPKYDQWNVEITLTASEGKGMNFNSQRIVEKLTIGTGSVQEKDALVGRYGIIKVPNPFF